MSEQVRPIAVPSSVWVRIPGTDLEVWQNTGRVRMWLGLRGWPGLTRQALNEGDGMAENEDSVDRVHLYVAGGASFFGDANATTVGEHTFPEPGPATVTWPDGTVITGEQFQNTIDMVTTASAQGRDQALLEVRAVVQCRMDAAELADGGKLQTWDALAGVMEWIEEQSR